MHARARTHTHTHTHTHNHTHLHAHTHKHIYTHTHTTHSCWYWQHIFSFLSKVERLPQHLLSTIFPRLISWKINLWSVDVVVRNCSRCCGDCAGGVRAPAAPRGGGRHGAHQLRVRVPAHPAVPELCHPGGLHQAVQTLPQRLPPGWDHHG